MKFLIDNNLSPTLGVLLTANGYDTVHIRDLGLSTAEDEQIFLIAENQDRVLISADTDFGFILSQWKKPHPSIFLFRYMPSDPVFQCNILLNVLSGYEPEIVSGSLLVIEPDRVRIKKLPF